MHVLVIRDKVLPYPVGVSGVAVVAWSAIKTLIDRGHKVSICTFGRSRKDRYRQEARELLMSQGVAIHDLDDRVQKVPRPSGTANLLQAARRALSPILADLYPTVSLGPHLQSLIDLEKPDVLYAFDFSGAAVVNRLARRPSALAAVVDLDHVTRIAKRSMQEPLALREQFKRTIDIFAQRRLPEWEVSMLKPFERVVDHAAHHAKWLREKGVRQCIYLPNPVVDAVGSRCFRERGEYRVKDSRPKILFIGRLDSTINRPALELLAKEILPILVVELGPEGFQLDVVGHGRLAPDVANRLDCPSVRLRGFVQDAQTEFLSCDVLLVPTPSELGFRTRVAEGFSYGCCVVSHTANALGMPELVHEDNSLLASDGVGLASQTVRALRDSELRHRLERRARETYEAKLDAAKVCGRITDELEALVRQHATSTGRVQAR